MTGEKRKAYIGLIIQTFIVGLSFLFVKLTLTVTDPLTALAHRFTVAFVFATICVLFSWVKIDIKLKDIIHMLPMVLFNPIIFFSTQIFGLVYISSSEAGIIHATMPIFTALLASIFLEEHSNTRQKISIFLSVLGVVYIFFMKGIDFNWANFKGAILILISAISVAIYNVMARKLTKKYRLMDLTYIMLLFGFISFNIMALISHGLDGTINTYFMPFTSPIFTFSILYLGVLSSFVTSILTNYSLLEIEASKMSVFSNFGTLVTIIAGVLILNEKIEYYHIIGAIMIIIGVIGANIKVKE